MSFNRKRILMHFQHWAFFGFDFRSKQPSVNHIISYKNESSVPLQLSSNWSLSLSFQRYFSIRCPFSGNMNCSSYSNSRNVFIVLYYGTLTEPVCAQKHEKWWNAIAVENIGAHFSIPLRSVAITCDFDVENRRSSRISFASKLTIRQFQQKSITWKYPRFPTDNSINLILIYRLISSATVELNSCGSILFRLH